MTEATLVIKATVIFTIALVAAGAARRARASVRSLILAAAFGAALALPLASAVVPEHEVSIPQAYAPAFLVEEPAARSAATATGAAAPSAADTPSRRLPLLWLTRGLWLLGVAVTGAPLLFGLWRVRQVRRRSRAWVAGQQVAGALRPGSSRRAVAVLLHDDVVTPMTCGWIRPAIVMPADAPEWSAADVRRALVHELEHVRRRDWPIHVLARVTCALYWFHPAAWVAWRQLTLECERACDDAVVAQAESTAYAEQLVALARRFAKRSAAPILSMADRRRLSTRVAWILNADVARGRAGLTATALVLTGAVAAAAAIAPVQALPSAAALRFDVASVRPNDGSDATRGFGFTPEAGRVRLRNQTLRTIVSVAYAEPFGLFFPDERISGGPAWMNSERFTLEGRAGGAATPRELGLMLRTLLAERFKLKVRLESREAPVYALVRARRDGDLGPELRRSPTECQAGGRCGIGGGRGRWVLSAADMNLFAITLREVVGRDVVDRTDLGGSFDGTLTWAPTPEELGPLGERAPAAPEFGVSLFTALQEQFGLRLQSERGTTTHLVVERAERPIAN